MTLGCGRPSIGTGHRVGRPRSGSTIVGRETRRVRRASNSTLRRTNQWYVRQFYGQSATRPISHDYPDELPPPGQVRCYGFEEVFAEKIRAMGERSRPRDLYDIVNLFRRPDFRQHADLVLEVLMQKCESKGVPVPTVETIQSSPMFGELRSEWENMLAHQLRELPDFEHFWADVPHLFAWLNGSDPDADLEPWPLADGEEVWTPPPTFWASDPGSRLELVRFAAVNRLLVDLGYNGGNRLIEPYSLRRTRAGNVVLYGFRADGRGIRSYRIDQIQSVTVTGQPFKPRFIIEFPETGFIPTQPWRSGRAGHCLIKFW